MIRQIASLTCLAGATLTLLATTMVDQQRVAMRLLAVHGPQRAMEIAAQHGGMRALLNLVAEQIAQQWFYLLSGLSLGVLARAAVFFWRRRPVADPTSKVSVVDEASGRYVMWGVPFAHAPTIPKLAVADVSDVPGAQDASLIELELLGAFRAGGQPADVQGYHGVSLFEHSLGVWLKALEKYGPCTLESILALAHDAGKMISFVPDKEGGWKRLTPRHEAYNAAVVRRMPSFYKIPVVERELIMLSLGYMEGCVAAKDVPPSVISAVEHVHVLDVNTTASEVSERRAGEIDVSQLIQAVIDLAKAPPQDWNVNRTFSHGSPAGAIHLGSGVLLVSGRALRTAIATRVDAATTATLALQIPSADWHQSYNDIAAAIQKAGLGMRIVNNVASESGWFSLRVGAAKMPHAIALRTHASEALQVRWGVNQLEIVVSEAKK